MTKILYGLDVSDRTIEVSALQKKGGRIAVIGRARALLPQGVVSRGRIVDEKKLSEALDQVFFKAMPKGARRNNIIFGIPEYHSYARVSRVTTEEGKGIDESAREEAESSIPLPADDLLLHWSEISREKEGGAKVLLCASSREVVTEWSNFFTVFGYDVLLFDFFPFALFRAVNKDPNTSLCLVDIGSVTTDIFIFDGLTPRFAFSLNIGGDTLTNEISKTLSISYEEAEKQKIEHGLNSEQRVFSILIKSLETITRSLTRSIAYYEKNTHKKISRIILSGGTSLTRGIDDYFSSNVKVTTDIARSWIQDDSQTSKRTRSLYLASEGMALRGIDKRFGASDPFLEVIKTNVKQGEAKRGNTDFFKGSKLNEEFGLDFIQPFFQKLSASRHVLFGVIFAILLLSFIIFLFISKKTSPDALIDSQRFIDPVAPLEDDNESQEHNIFSPKEGEDPEIENIIENGIIHEDKGNAPTNTDAVLENEEGVEDGGGISVPMVQIRDTETGWLNVREGPGTDFSIITKVYPQESYPLLKETQEWYNIQIKEGVNGWIFSEYAKKR